MTIDGNLALDAARHHLQLQHDPQTTQGWITLAKKDPTTHRYKQYHYQPEELADHLSQWTEEDVYYSQNTFFKPQRRIDTIRQLRTLYVDLDVYNLGLKPEWVLGKLEFEYFGHTIPDPNVVIFSGRGLVLIWNIQPIPHLGMPLWRAVENHFAEALKDLGADTKATDPARIFRLPGTINSKSHRTVTAQYRHDYRYDIHDLQYDYLPELTPAPKVQKAKKRGRKPKILNLFNIYTLHMTRAMDIAKLVELREGDMESCREYTCFLYRYFTCCYTSDPQRALEDTLSLNDEFTKPLSGKEVERATKSAEKAWAAKSNAKADEAAKAMGYPGAGYNISNTKLIEWLGITAEEQRELSTIIGGPEKRRRNTEAKRKARRAEGIKTKEEYNQERNKAKTQNALKLQKLMQNNPSWTNTMLAESMGMTVRNIQRLKKLI